MSVAKSGTFAASLGTSTITFTSAERQSIGYRLSAGSLKSDPPLKLTLVASVRSGGGESRIVNLLTRL